MKKEKDGIYPIKTGAKLMFIVYRWKGKLYQHKFKAIKEIIVFKKSIKVYFPKGVKYHGKFGFLN